MSTRSKNLVGKKFGLWTVISREENGSRNQSRWLCKCQCGIERIIDGSSLLQGKSKSCGCRHKLDLIGKRFGRLTVLEEVEPCDIKSGGKRRRFMCVCDCGNKKIIDGVHLTSGAIISCGCFMRERVIETSTTHGKTGTRLHRIWRGMKIRCSDKNSKDYKDYGAKGVIVCDEWLGKDGFQTFYDWAMANGYQDNLSIDRINPNGNYEPSNCRWADNIQQANNKRNNHYVEDNGEILTIAQLARKHKVSPQYFYKLMNKGVSITKTIERADRLSRG